MTFCFNDINPKYILREVLKNTERFPSAQTEGAIIEEGVNKKDEYKGHGIWNFQAHWASHHGKSVNNIPYPRVDASTLVVTAFCSFQRKGGKISRLNYRCDSKSEMRPFLSSSPLSLIPCCTFATRLVLCKLFIRLPVVKTDSEHSAYSECSSSESSRAHSRI